MINSAPTILVADHDATERLFLTDNLTADGYAIVAVASRSGAIAQLREREVDLVIANVDTEALDLLDAIRDPAASQTVTAADVPVIVLADQADELQIIRVLERGGDDVLAMPFSYLELRARVAAVLRRTAPRQAPARLTAGEIAVDIHRREVTVAGQPVALSATEYELLSTLATEPTRTFTRDELMRAVWGYSNHRTRTLDSHACRLRARLAGATHPVLVNVWGVGYRLIPEPLGAQ
jgi:DNA-binding response OmpR family regulator